MSEFETIVKELEVSRAQKQHETDVISDVLRLLRNNWYEQKRKCNTEVSIRQDGKTSWSIYINGILQIAPMDSLDECIQYLERYNKTAKL